MLLDWINLRQFASVPQRLRSGPPALKSYEALGVDDEFIACYLGVSHSTVEKWHSGETEIPFSYHIILASTTQSILGTCECDLQKIGISQWAEKHLVEAMAVARYWLTLVMRESLSEVKSKEALAEMHLFYAEKLFMKRTWPSRQDNLLKAFTDHMQRVTPNNTPNEETDIKTPDEPDWIDDPDRFRSWGV